MSTSPDRQGRAHAKRLAYLRAVGVGGYTDAGPVQRRIRFLHDQLRISLASIAERMGTDKETIKAHYHGINRKIDEPLTKCTRVVERKVLTARFIPADSYRFPAVGIRRRLQALQCAGYPLKVISGLTGKTIAQIHATMCGKSSRGFVLRENAELFIAAYDKLQFTSPEEWGVEPVPIKQTRTRSRKNGYAPATCWDPDTIDDPDVFAEWTGMCGSIEGHRIHRREGIPMCGPCREAMKLKPAVPTGTIYGFSHRKMTEARERRGFTKAQLARLIGVHETTVYYWEAGQARPSRQDKIELILSALDVTIEELTESEDE